jgi:hypothetical protein
VITDTNGAHYFAYGSLFYAKAISSIQVKGKEYGKGFEDLNYKAIDKSRFKFIENHQATFENNTIKVNLKNLDINKNQEIILTPFGKTILRQVAF